MSLNPSKVPEFINKYSGFAAAGAVAILLLAAAAPADAGVDLRSIHRPSRAESPVPDDIRIVVAADTVSDPTGDTVGVGPVQLDITSLSVDSMGTNLVIGVSFSGPISAPDSGLGNAVDGLIDIDADQSAATGDVPHADVVPGRTGSTGMGNDFYVDLFAFNSGQVDIVDDPTETVVGSAPISFTSDSLTVTIPLALLGGDDGAVNVAAVMGTFDEITDFAPNNGSVSSGMTTPLPDGPSILLNNDRFRVIIRWGDFDGGSGDGQVVPFRSDDSGLFWFFQPDNWEVLIKVIDACDEFDRYWVFAAATTNVEYTITVVDTQTNRTKQYFNLLGTQAPAITDTNAFATCP